MFSRIATSAVAGVVRGSQVTPGIQNVAARLYHEKVIVANMFVKVISQTQNFCNNRYRIN